MPLFNAAYRFWHLLGSGYTDTKELKHQVFLTSFCQTDTGAVNALLTNSDIVSTNKEKARLWIVCIDTFNDPRLSSLYREACAMDKTMLLFKPMGTEGVFAFFSQDAACWDCYYKRLQILDGTASFLYNKLRPAVPITEPAIYHSSSVKLFSAWIGFAVACFFRQVGADLLAEKLHTFNLLTMQTASYTIPRLPACQTCANTTPPDKSQPNSLQLRTHKIMVS